MSNKTFTIKITGSGTAEQLEIALRQVARNIQDLAQNGKESELDGASWEDPTIMTEINEE